MAKKKKRKYINDKKTYSKGLVKWIVFNSTIWIYLTYVLAFIGKDQIAETLSGEIVTVIIGTVVTYSLKALFENISKGKANKIDDTEEFIDETDKEDLL